MSKKLLVLLGTLLCLSSCTFVFTTENSGDSSQMTNSSNHLGVSSSESSESSSKEYSSIVVDDAISLMEVRTGDYVNQVVTTSGTVSRMINGNHFYIQSGDYALEVFSDLGNEEIIEGSTVKVTGFLEEELGHLKINGTDTLVELVSEIGENIQPLYIDIDNLESLLLDTSNDGRLICFESCLESNDLSVPLNGEATLESFNIDYRSLAVYIDENISSEARINYNNAITNADSGRLSYVGVYKYVDGMIVLSPIGDNDIYIDQGDKYFVSLNSTTYSINGRYTTGNYGSESVDSYSFEYYRAVEGDYSNCFTLLPYVSDVDDGSMSGSIYNTTKIKDISKIELTYSTSFEYGYAPSISYGDTYQKEFSQEITPSISEVTRTLRLDGADYFQIKTGSSELNIKSIIIYFAEDYEFSSLNYANSGDNDFRINPTKYSGDLVDGISKVNVPIEITQNGSGYSITQTKEYTYYSYNYVVDNPSLASQASCITPEDVSAYYIAFGEFPANYVSKSDYNDAYNIFGDSTRCVSTYSRTDGYANAVPWQVDEITTPLYHEFDIDLDGTYSKSNRGVGRVVAWDYGFNCDGYDDSIVCVYTDDHYATFQEYLNIGEFGERFNAEMSPTGYIHSGAMTLIN